MAVDPHSYVADLDPDVFLNPKPDADPDPALQNLRSGLKLCKKTVPFEEFACCDFSALICN